MILWTSQNAHQQVPVISQKSGEEEMYKSDDEYVILPLTAPAWSSWESQRTKQD